MNLYELTENYANLLALLGDPTIDENTIYYALGELEGSLEEKAEGYARVRQTLLAEAAAYKAEADRLTALRKARENNAARLMDDMGAGMHLAQKTEIKTAIGKWKFQNNPPAVYIADEKALPPQFWRQQEPIIDKQGISDALKAGQVVPGAELRQSEGLRFR